mmetsp:Transcript_25642/g.87697  ORF Transcript_25642/g.87697 Transcript_25642/m.87697 type:complete len:247 (-) Transcript_25642:366-1106(-)
MYARQIGWLEARENHTLLVTEALNSKTVGFRVSKPRRKLAVSTPQRSPPKPCGIVAHDLHVRRYARARDDKERSAAALTWSSSCSRPRENVRSQQRSQQYAADAQGVFKSNAQVPTKPGCEELGNAGQIEIKPLPNWDLLSEDENSSNEESFFSQLQRERKQWAKEQSKLTAVIELQQHELHARGLKVEDKARKVAQAFVDAVTTFEGRLVKIERDVASELSSIRQLTERLDCIDPKSTSLDDRQL